MINSLVYLLFWLIFRVLIAQDRYLAESELEVIVLRHQLKVLTRQHPKPKIRNIDRAFLTAAARRLKTPGSFIVTPRTLLRWHRKLVAYKWARYSRRPRRRGRPPLAQSTKDLILRLARENERWGYRRIHGELVKLGVKVSATAVRVFLRRSGFGPAQRHDMLTWTGFLSMQAKTILACDFFTVDTLFLKRFYVRVLLIRVTASDQGLYTSVLCRIFRGRSGGILINSLVYLMFRLVFRVLIGHKRYQADSELEVMVLRHQLRVLKRQNPNPRIKGFDHAFLVAAVRRLKKPSLSVLIVTPRTILLAYKTRRL